MRIRPLSWLRHLAAALLLAAPLLAAAQANFSKEQLDQMTAPVALYPDSLLAQLFMATTYPDQFALAYQWSKAHPDSKGDDAVKMVESEPWDPSVQSMVAFPEVLITLGEKSEWVRSMGDAFLAQPEDVMNSVQRLRQQAQKAGNLKSNEQIKVSTEAAPPPEAASSTTVVQQAPAQTQYIVIEPTQPSVVYVPSYNPAVVYGAWPYPAYPPYYYPTPPGYWFSRTVATGIAWGVGIGVTNALWGGCNWGRGDVNVNVNRYNNINTNNRINNGNWNHNTNNRKTAYRGGDAQRQNLDRKTQAGNREQYRGKDASRDASRERAQQSMQQRGVDTGGSARDRAQAASRDGGAARANAGGMDRDAARQNAQSADRGAAQQRAQSASRDNALKGAGDRQAGQQYDRGNASRQSAQSRPQAQQANMGGGGGARAGGGGGGGGARAGGGGGGGRGGGGGGGRGGGGGGRR